MVLCLLALPVFAVLSIFSVKYRKLTMEALDCLFKTATLRKCRSGLDDRIKADVTGRMLKYSPKAAGFIYRHYKLLSWIVLALFVWSIYGTSVGIYNYAVYGNCNGPADTGFCMLDPTGKNSKTSEVDVDVQDIFILPVLEGNDPIIGNENAELTIIEFGCYACPYTRSAEPIVKEVLDYYKGKINLQFKTFVIPRHTFSYQAALAANCAQDQGQYQRYHEVMFEKQDYIVNASFSEFAATLGLNMTEFNDCMAKEKFKGEINEDTLMGMNAGVTGTPTFFINQQKIVGPKPFRTFKAIINKELEK